MPTPSPKPTPRAGGASGRRTVKLRPQDPFDLIRLLARSQSDPRKAIAELVQNSLDAGARRIEIQWFNDKGRRAISVWDDGSGVFPDVERPEALRRIAQTIGHSHKRDLTPAQRREELILGKYGIGLIGFWSVGEVLEMKSRVGGERAHVLRMVEDKAQGEVFPSRSRRLDEVETFTEITVRNVHEAAINKIRPPRLQAYLANELRGQLLEREATVRIRDRVARGRARKEFIVKPQPYLGRRIEDLVELDVPGFEDARLELYLVAPDEGRRGIVALSCGGTLVLDDIGEIDGFDEPRKPWCDGRFEGVIDFPELHVSPATRRGFAHDEPVAAFLGSLVGLESELATRVEDEAERRAALRGEHVAKEIRRAFATVAEALPEYDFFDVRGKGDDSKDEAGADSLEAEGAMLGVNPVTPQLDEGETSVPHVGAPPEVDAAEDVAATAAQKATRADDDSAPETTKEPDLLFPPGPFEQVTIQPRRMRLKALATRRVAARATDGDGRACSGTVDYHWFLDGPGELVPDGATATYTAPERAPDGARATINVRASQSHEGEVFEATATASVAFEAPDLMARVQGIPEPHPVSEPGAPWRSRVIDGRWEFNEAHRDFLAVADVEAQRLRYLIHLFAKEVVLRNFGRPGDADVLERMVEVLTRIGGTRGKGTRGT